MRRVLLTLASVPLALAAIGSSATALADAPVTETLAPGALRSDRATLGGRIEAGGEPTTFYVEYGRTTGYGESSPASHDGDAGSEAGFAVRARLVTGLDPETTYHYRVVAVNGSGTSAGEDRTFTTPPAPTVVRERAYEQVSPADKNGYGVAYGLPGQGSVFGAGVSPDGATVIYNSWGLFNGAMGGNISYQSTRTPSGWTTVPLSPPVHDPDGQVVTGQTNVIEYATRDLVGQTLFRTSDPIDPADTNGVIDIYARAGSSPFERVTIGNDGTQVTGGFMQTYAVADGGRAVLFTVTSHLLPEDAAAPADRLYLRREGRTYLVTVGPNGQPLGGAPDSPELDDNLDSRSLLSEDGRRAVFGVKDGERHDIYQWVLGRPTVEVSASQRTVPVDPTPDPVHPRSYLIRATPDGSRVLFVSNAQLTDDAPLGGGIYEYSAATGRLTLRAGGQDVDVGAYGGVAAASEDLSRALFQVRVRDTGQRYELRELVGDAVTTIADGNDSQPVIDLAQRGMAYQTDVTPDARAMLFKSRQSLTGYDAAGMQMIYLYRAGRGLTCLTCRPADGPPSADAGLTRGSATALSDDGTRAIFDTAEALVPSDGNNRVDAYEWHEGKVSLISSGRSESDSYVVGLSASGRDAIFATTESLLPQDRDGKDMDVYDARIGGGFAAAPSTSAPACTGDDCQGGRAAPLSLASPASVAFTSQEGAVRPAARPRGRVTVAKPRTVRGSAATLTVRVSGGGTVLATGSSVGRVRRTVTRAGTVRLRVALRPPAMRALQRRKRVTAAVRVTFTPKAGRRASTVVKVTFEGGR